MSAVHGNALAGAAVRLVESLRGTGSVRRGERCVLVLREESACWTLWRDAVCIDEHREAIDAATTTGCPWPDEADRAVDVVVDSPLDDIESVLLAGLDETRGERLGTLRRQRLKWRLQHRHPDASVHMAPARVAPFVASLSRSTLPPAWFDYLSTLQSGALTVNSLRSATALPDAFEREARGDVLCVTRGESLERHTLYRSGWPAFTRLAETSAGTREALDETLAHVAEVHGADDPRLQYRDGRDETHRLARRALEARGRRDPRAASARALLDKRRSLDEIRRLQFFTLATSLIACATVFLAAVHGMQSARERARALAAGEAVAAHVRTLGESVAARHPDPDGAVASLAFIDARAAVRPVPADTLLRLLADVLTDHPGVRLDRLAWSVNVDPGAVPGGSPGATFVGATNLAPRAVGESVRTGTRLELAGRLVAVGAVPPSVGERQRRFEAFVADLGARVGAQNLHVALSPATAASRDDGGAGGHDYELAIEHPAPVAAG